MTLAEIAARNVQRRRDMLQRLAPVRVEARAKSEEFYKARQGAKDARAVLEMVSGLKHVPGFFPTPPKVIDRMMEAACISPTHSVLEPSAGKGDLILACLKAGVSVHCIQGVERNHTLAEYCIKRGYAIRCADFLEYEPGQLFDRVLMNPPFDHGVDEKHIRHAFDFLQPGGRLVALACNTTGRKLERWAEERDGSVAALPAGSFSTSDRPTNVSTCLIVAEKS